MKKKKILGKRTDGEDRQNLEEITMIIVEKQADQNYYCGKTRENMEIK